MKKLIAEGVDGKGRPILRELNSENVYEYYSMTGLLFSERDDYPLLSFPENQAFHNSHRHFRYRQNKNRTNICGVYVPG